TSHFKQYDVDLFGWKYNMDNIHAAILVEQIKRIDALLQRRREIYKRYSEAFEGMRGIELQAIRPEAFHACLLFTILVDPKKRDEVMRRLQDRGIGVSINYYPVHLMTYYRERFGYRRGMFPAAEEIGSRTISLPLYPKLTDEEISYVIDTVGESVRET
ncbi:MAG TPA: DegT/DnrJ/EryC1/StrS aminotransferase family protein, partial [Candidatus Eisenbacteria bacterium]|nr:DegT/DnrJ/EryC1/StrS aminotransferase family protein [Candidatus Eisenbacteria bacterium]